MSELSELLSRPDKEGRKEASYWFLGDEMDGETVKTISAAISALPYARTGFKAGSAELNDLDQAEAHVRRCAEDGEPVSFVAPPSMTFGEMHDKFVALCRAVADCDLRAVEVRIDGEGRVGCLGIGKSVTPDTDPDHYIRNPGATENRTPIFTCDPLDCRPLADARQIEASQREGRVENLLHHGIIEPNHETRYLVRFQHSRFDE